MAWTRLLPVDQCPPGKGQFVEAGDIELAVFHLTEPDRFAVIDNSCPHASGNLAGGELTGRIVSCPWHHWEFDVTTGVCTRSDAARVNRYPVELRDGWVWADTSSPF